MPVHLFPSEPRPSAETSHGRSNGRGPGSVRLGFPSERSLKVRHLPWEQEQAGALPAALTISRGASAGDGQDFTGLASVVRLHARVAFGLQALQRCSGLLNRRARGSTVATHHFRIRGETIIILRFERRVCRWESCRMHQFTPR